MKKLLKFTIHGSFPLLQGAEAKYGIGRIGIMRLLQGREAKYGMGISS